MRRRKAPAARLARVEAGDDDAFGELWEEIYHQGDVNAGTVESTRAILRGSAVAADGGMWLHLPAACCGGRPDSVGAGVREVVAGEADDLRGRVEAGEAAERSGAVALLAASGALVEGDEPLLRQLLADGEAEPRAYAALALGILGRATRRDALERAVRNDSAWERAWELPELLRQHRLPDTRDSLHRSLASRSAPH